MVPLLCVLVGLALTLTTHPTTLLHFVGVGITTAGLTLGLRRLLTHARKPVPPTR